MRVIPLDIPLDMTRVTHSRAPWHFAVKLERILKYHRRDLV